MEWVNFFEYFDFIIVNEYYVILEFNVGCEYYFYKV